MYQWKRFSNRVRESFHAFCHSDRYFHLDRIIESKKLLLFLSSYENIIPDIRRLYVIISPTRQIRPRICSTLSRKCVENLNKSIVITFKDKRYTRVYARAKENSQLVWKVLTQVDADWLTVCTKSGEHILLCDYEGRLDRYRNVPKSVVEPWNLSRIREFGSIPLRLFYLPRITPDTVSLFSKNILTASRTALVSYSLPRVVEERGIVREGTPSCITFFPPFLPFSPFVSLSLFVRVFPPYRSKEKKPIGRTDQLNAYWCAPS